MLSSCLQTKLRELLQIVLLLLLDVPTFAPGNTQQQGILVAGPGSAFYYYLSTSCWSLLYTGPKS
jgi:hypothetical protein